MDAIEDLMGKGFELAYFIIPDRSIAVQVLRDAMHKLEVQCDREQKRAYWRDKYLKRKITRIVRDGADALQWLIYLGAERHEKQQEESGQQNTRDMIVRYVKYLVQTSTAMSSFYVTVGLHRLLRDYSTSQTQQVYEWVTQDYPGPQEYRRVKKILLNQLQIRFGNFLRIRKSDRGELRFEIFELQHRWADWVDECLKAFTPWSTRQLCLRTAGNGDTSEVVPYLSRAATRKMDHNSIEIHRCHLFIDPACHAKITKKLGLDSPRHRLAVPMFFLNGENGKDDCGDSRKGVPQLTEEERKAILADLSQETFRRQQASPDCLKIVAHGTEYARLDINRADQKRCHIPEGLKLIEIWAEDKAGDLLIATYWIGYTQFDGIAAATATVNLGNGRQLLLDVQPESNEMENHGAVLRLKCQASSRLAAWTKAFESFPSLRRLPQLILAPALLVAVVWIAAMLQYRREIVIQRAKVEEVRTQLAQERLRSDSLEKRLDAGRGATAVVNYRLQPDEFRIRSGQGTKEPVVQLSPQSSLVILELPLDESSVASYRATLREFVENREILTESLLPVESNSTAVVRFALPAVFVENGKHYIVTLNSMARTGQFERVGTFTFYIVKK